METNSYQKPDFTVFRLGLENILCTSRFDSDNGTENFIFGSPEEI